MAALPEELLHRGLPGREGGPQGKVDQIYMTYVYFEE
jgi:hypothetical protein